MKNRKVTSQKFGIEYGQKLLTNYEWAVMIRTELNDRMSFTGDYEGILQADIMKALNYYIEEMEMVKGSRK